MLQYCECMERAGGESDPLKTSNRTAVHVVVLNICRGTENTGSNSINIQECSTDLTHLITININKLLINKPIGFMKVTVTLNSLLLVGISQYFK